jgi:hypothetical protein|tara:strand:- start:277 stop:534 length:258 start_codon:yes stop_codon:yes gene_type:complete
MVNSKQLPKKFLRKNAEVPRYIKRAFVEPYWVHDRVVNGWFRVPDEFVFHDMTLEESFRKALLMEKKQDPLFIAVTDWIAKGSGL